MKLAITIMILGLLALNACAQTANTQIPNPASKDCIDKGGELEIRDMTDGQIGVCKINGKECEEWALFRGEGCVAPEATVESDFIACPTERQVACTKEYMPVCGKIGLNMGDTIFQTYGNKCEACAAMKVVGYTQGECAAEIVGRSYKSTDPQACAAMRFTCPNGKQYFGDDTGCGCEDINDDETSEVPPCAATTCETGNSCIEGVGCVPYTECTDPRPEACTMEYNPVCADKDNGIRCITAPCPSTDKVTYGNGCSACGDKDVYGYVPGACEDLIKEEPTPKLAAPRVKCATDDDRTRASDLGFTCVDSCPQDSYMGQIGMEFCIDHYGEKEIKEWSVCKVSTDCPTEHTCAYALTTTDHKTISWGLVKDANKQPKDALRCVPEPYANYAIQSGGLYSVDENGELSVAIA